MQQKICSLEKEVGNVGGKPLVSQPELQAAILPPKHPLAMLGHGHCSQKAIKETPVLTLPLMMKFFKYQLSGKAKVVFFFFFSSFHINPLLFPCHLKQHSEIKWFSSASKAQKPITWHRVKKPWKRHHKSPQISWSLRSFHPGTGKRSAFSLLYLNSSTSKHLRYSLLE